MEIENRPDGSVWLRCLGDYSVFVQSYYLVSLLIRIWHRDEVESRWENEHEPTNSL